MSEIRITEKPEEISWETIRSILQQAHKIHHDAGIVMYVSTLSAEELENRVRKNNGKCYVAFYGDQVVGTASYIHRAINRWYYKGDICEQTMVAVLPSFQGRHIATELTKVLEEELQRQGIPAVCFDTVEQNTGKIEMELRNRYRLVDYHFNNGHYSVEMMKWLDMCPFSERYCKMRYLLKKTKVRMKHTLRPNLERIR